LAKNLALTDTVTIASSGTTSQAISMTRNRVPIAVLTPAALTGTTFTFQASVDGTNFYDLYNGSSAYSVTVAPSRYIALNPDVFQGVFYIRIVSGSAEGALRTIYVISGEL
jgi:hypothetical protein